MGESETDEPGASVATLVLRATERHETEVLLRRADAADGEGWFLPRRAVDRGERDSEVALASIVEGSACEPARLYAAPFSIREGEAGASGEAGGRVGVFVAFLQSPHDAEAPGAMAWSSLRDAGETLTRESERAIARRVHEAFVRQSPDEALRIF